jgi:hypothetical protein
MKTSGSILGFNQIHAFFTAIFSGTGQSFMVKNP